MLRVQNLRSSRCRPVPEGRDGEACGAIVVAADGKSFVQSHCGSLIARTITATASSATANALKGIQLLFMAV